MKASPDPAFMIVGAAKSGTTFLSHYLSLHPQLNPCKQKEPCFFSNDEIFSNGLDWYHDLFPQKERDTLNFEASTNYTFYPHYPNSAERIHQNFPNTKIIYIMRHPVERTYSHFVHRHAKELAKHQPFTRNFAEHIEADPLVIDASQYKQQIEQFLHYFPKENLLLLFTEELKKSPQQILDTICTFVGVDKGVWENETFDRQNQASTFQELVVRKQISGSYDSNFLRWIKSVLPQPMKEFAYQIIQQMPHNQEIKKQFTPPPLDKPTRQRLLEEFAPSNKWVETYTGRALPDWYQ